MTWFEYARTICPQITGEEVEYILWEETPYPAICRDTLYKFRSAVRYYRWKLKLKKDKEVKG